MLTNYINAAMHKAKYEILSDDHSFYGDIPECNGVNAQADTLEDCRSQLEEVLEEWILFRIYKNLSIPKINGISLDIQEVA